MGFACGELSTPGDVSGATYIESILDPISRGLDDVERMKRQSNEKHELLNTSEGLHRRHQDGE